MIRQSAQNPHLTIDDVKNLDQKQLTLLILGEVILRYTIIEKHQTREQLLPEIKKTMLVEYPLKKEEEEYIERNWKISEFDRCMVFQYLYEITNKYFIFIKNGTILHKWHLKFGMHFESGYFIIIIF